MALSGSPGLLSLPLSIRTTIYEQAGLLRPCPVNLVQEKGRFQKLPRHFRSPRHGKTSQTPCLMGSQGAHYDEDSSDYELLFRWVERNEMNIFHEYQRHQQTFRGDPTHEKALHCTDPALQVSILRVCKQIYYEALSVLYGKNQFVLDCRWEDILLFRLQKLGPEACSRLRKLHIIYTSLRIETSARDTLFASSEHALSAGELISFPTQAHWLDLCTFLSNRLTPKLTSISIFAHLHDLGAIQHTFGALQTLPQLRNLAINVVTTFRERDDDTGRQADFFLRRVITDKTATSAESCDATKTFPFLRLPVELQQIIMLEAGLGRRQHDPTPRGLHVPLSIFTVAYRNQDVCCNSCLDLPKEPRPFQKNPYNCSCNRSGSQSSTCSCQGFPLALFFVSKGIRELAYRFFYSLNQFDWDAKTRPGSGAFPCGPPPAIYWLRRLTDERIVISPDKTILDINNKTDSDEYRLHRIQERIEDLFKFSAKYCDPGQMSVELILKTSRVALRVAHDLILDIQVLRRQYGFGEVQVHSNRNGKLSLHILDDKHDPLSVRDTWSVPGSY